MLRRTCLAVLATAALACSSPPNQERHQADGAIAAAHAAEATTYAPALLKSAEDAIAQYDAAVTQRDYRLALQLALEARDTAYEAVKHAGDEKAAARSTAERLITEGDALVRSAHARLSGPARLAALTAEEVRRLVSSVETALQEARAAIERHDYRAAVMRLEPASNDLRTKLDASAPRSSR